MARHPIRSPEGEDSFRRIVDACFRGEAGSSVPLSVDTADLIETGVLDSITWVSFLRAVETASGTSDLVSDLNEQPASIASILAALRSSNKGSLPSGDKKRGVAGGGASPPPRPSGSCSAPVPRGGAAAGGERPC